MPQPQPNLTDHDMALFRAGTTEELMVVASDPLDRNDPPHPLLLGDAEAGRLEIINDSDTSVFDTTFPAEGNDDIRRIALGTYGYNFDTRTDAPYDGYKYGSYLAFWRFRTGPPPLITEIRKRQLIRVVPYRYFRLIDILRLQVDKARKSLTTAAVTGRKSSSFGYSDAWLSVYLDMGANLINTIPPYTGMTVMNFDQSATWLLIQAATLIALESQQIFAVDTDYAYSLGGNSLTIDHVGKIAQVYGNPLISQFFEMLTKYKQKFRSKGTVMVQMQYSFSIGRFFSEVPSGFFSRWGLGVGPVGPSAGIGV